jgi:hypothetical protein
MITVTLSLMFISDCIGITEEDWTTIYWGKEVFVCLYFLFGLYIYTLQKDNLNEKMVNEFAKKMYK